MQAQHDAMYSKLQLTTFSAVPSLCCAISELLLLDSLADKLQPELSPDLFRLFMRGLGAKIAYAHQ